MESKESVDLSGYGVADNEIQTEKETAPKADGTEIFLSSPIRGKAVPLEKVDDEVFSAGILGQGIAIEPSEARFSHRLTVWLKTFRKVSTLSQ